jgi:hypothetical protein
MRRTGRIIFGGAVVTPTNIGRHSVYSSAGNDPGSQAALAAIEVKPIDKPPSGFSARFS